MTSSQQTPIQKHYLKNIIKRVTTGIDPKLSINNPERVY